MIRLALIGPGGVAHWHADAFSRIRGVRLFACCGRDRTKAEAFALRHAIPSVYTDYRELLDRDKPDAVAITAPDGVHAEISIAALQRRIPVFCEKPLAVNTTQARRMLAAARKNRTVAMINFSKRNSAALQKAAAIVREGGLGLVTHVDAHYLQHWISTRCWGDWRTDPAWSWRLSTRLGSSGALGDIGSHIYDMASFVCGDFKSLSCRLKTFDKTAIGSAAEPRKIQNPPVPAGRHHPNPAVQHRSGISFDANDAFVTHVEFFSGALGSIHASRRATGCENRETLAVYGDKCSLILDLAESYSHLKLFSLRRKKWVNILCPAVPDNFQRFIRAVRSGRNEAPDFSDGLKNRAYLDASFRSDQAGRIIRLRQAP